jgi:hypothetical protein
VLAVAAVDRILSMILDDGISAFKSCVVVDLWQSLSEWRLLLSKCVVLCCRENVGTNIKFLVKQCKSRGIML